jgi:predicted nucleotidyltransferase
MTDSLAHDRKLLRHELPRLAAAYEVSELALFGSRVRGEEHAGSDLDVLVEFRVVPSLLRWRTS